MAKDKLIANRRLRYGRQIVEKNGPFEAGRMESQLLRTLGHARMEPAETLAPVATPAVADIPKPVEVLPDPAPAEVPQSEPEKAEYKPKHSYYRRDLKAED